MCEFVINWKGRCSMKKVFIIKNIGNNATKINQYAEESYINNERRYYNTSNYSLNQEYLMNSGLSIGDKGLILLISYDNAKEIKELYIGDDAEIVGDWNISYIMYRKLTIENDKRAIQSIIDKIDLDIDKDYDKNTYIIISYMESLYNELADRIKPLKRESVNNKTLPSKDIGYNDYVLCDLAQHDNQSIRIMENQEGLKYRTEFQRDRERIVNCKAFRRMVDKAQIFSANKGDYYRTRMTHTLEVNQIAKAIAFALQLNLDLTEAIALSHDLGHTPFGHQGERTLDDILSGKIDVGIVMPHKLLESRVFGSFKHNYQSAKVLSRIEEKYVDFHGLDVSIQVIEGALKHTKIKKEVDIFDFLEPKYVEQMCLNYDREKCISASLEGQTVAIADEIAQRGHDVDDALTSGVMSIDELFDRLKIKKCDKLLRNLENEIKSVEHSCRLISDRTELKVSRIVSSIVNYFITDAIEYSLKSIHNSSVKKISMMNDIEFVKLSDEAKGVNDYLERIVQKKVICNYEVARADYNASEIISTLFGKYYYNPRLLHTGTLNKIFYDMLNSENLAVSNSAVNLSDGSVALVNAEIIALTKDDVCSYNELTEMPEIKDKVGFEKRKILIRNIVDYIAGMTDGYAIDEFQKLR